MPRLSPANARALGDRRQLWTPQPIVIANVSGVGGHTGDAECRLVLPDSRVRAKVSLLFTPSGAITLPVDCTDQGASLYMAEEEFNPVSQISEDSVALVGTHAVFQALPLSPGLAGYSREFVTAADSIHLYLNLNSGEVAPTAGQWIVAARIQPDGQRLPDEDWDRTVSLISLVPVRVAST